MPHPSGVTDSPHAQSGPVTDSPGNGESSVPAPVAALPGTLCVPRKLLIPALIIFLLFLPAFARIVFTGAGPLGATDYRLHIDLALDMIRKREMVPHPLFPGLLLA